MNEDEERGAAFAFQATEEGVLEDMERYRLGLRWRDIPLEYTTRHAIRRGLLALGPALIQEGVDAAHISDRDQLDATGWVGRSAAYIIRGALYVCSDPRKLWRKVPHAPR